MSHPLPPPAQYAFGPFRLSADATLLTRDGTAVRLAPKVLQTLAVLVRNPGRVVTKDELMEAVWPGMSVAETGLTRNISVLRHALGPDGELIATVPSIGYRFTGSVQSVDEGQSPHVDAPARVVPRVPFVGRVAELARLDDALSRADAGRGSVIGLSGEPGIGKSTLGARFLVAAGPGRATGVGRCSELFASGEPFLPVLEVLEATTRFDASGPALARVAPTWLRLVSGAAPDAGARPHPGSPDRLLRELMRFLSEATRQQTLVWLLDDLHWADTGTVDVVAHIAPRLVDMRLLLVVTYRDRLLERSRHPFAGVRARLRATGVMDELALPLLTRAEVEEYVALIPEREVRAVGEDVYARSEGNPLFMSALVALLGEPADGGRPRQAVPESLRGAIVLMLEQLGDDDRRLLDAAAVVGDGFDGQVIAEMLGLDGLAVEDRLDAIAAEHDLLRRLPADTSAAHAHPARWRFRHALYSALLLETLPPSRRAQLSRAAADALLALRGVGDRSSIGTVALLLEAARAYPEAAARLAEASHYASHRLAYRDALELAERGMQCLHRATTLSSEARRAIELALVFAQAAAIGSLRGYGHPDVASLAQRASHLAALSDDAAAMARAYSQTVYVQLARGQSLAARDAARSLVALAERAGNDVLLVNAHVQAQIACHHLGHFADADWHAAQVMATARDLPPEDRFMSVFDPVVASLAESSRNAWITGRLATAERLAAEAVAVGRDVGNHESLAFAWLFDAWCRGYRGDWQGCASSAASGMSVADAAGTIQTLAWNRCAHGWALAHLGDPIAGARLLDEGIRLSRSILGEVALPQFRVMLAEVLLLAGDVQAARRWIGEALEASLSNDDHYFAAELYRVAAACTPPAATGDAESLLRQALSTAETQGAALLQLRAALAMHTLTGDAAPLRTARGRLAEPRDWPDVVEGTRRLAHDRRGHDVPTSGSGG